MRTMRAMAVIAGRVFARKKPSMAAQFANRARAERRVKLADAYERAIARELAARGRALHLHRIEGESPATQRAMDDLVHAACDRAQFEALLFKLYAHRTVSA